VRKERGVILVLKESRVHREKLVLKENRVLKEKLENKVEQERQDILD